MPATNLALVIRPDASFDVIDWPEEMRSTLYTLYTALRCDHVDVVDVSPELSMWLDGSGITIGVPIDVPATKLYAVANGRAHQFYYGTVVITGGVDRHGDTIGLTREQCEMVLGMIGIEIPEIPHQHTK
ncbi:DUF3846 domain-containing protein [Streptomyces fuscigenes]|uniref:DUF3846 domain-containing protein n=1 Tax=Streptomyces fuscigenes TaxID=1528880 RepID=UPI001F41E4BA|nr:DUF3846 domain-containing protein [Streptomyces fuscigenes]MCF3965385.1 DUF3846 domain-containing protein [Streptomyces fuscigenes]